MRIPAEALDKKAAYFLMSSALTPRPIAWIGTRGETGDNLAPFSYFMGVSSEPILVAVSIARGRRGALKDTLVNLLETGVCTVSLVHVALLDAMDASAVGLPPEVSEFEAFDIPVRQAAAVDAPAPAAARVVFECRLHSAQDLGSAHLVVLEVLAFEIEDGLVKEGRIDAFALDPVARLGGSYARLGEELHPSPRD
jgi:flavin reductase (DIM6/NTAB) family NADH-FMN oxidoreductase RutF